VNYSLVVGGGHRLASADQDFDEMGPVAAIQKIVGDSLLHQLAEGLSPHLFHGVETIAVGQEPGLEDRGRAGVVEAGEDFGLGKEALTNFILGGVLRPQPFDRDNALQLNVGRLVDDRHPSLAESLADQVTIAGA